MTAEASTHGAVTVASYPFDTVRLSCPKCGREGRYTRASLINRFGAGACMPDVLRELADCARYGSMGDPCQAVYPDLE